MAKHVVTRRTLPYEVSDQFGTVQWHNTVRVGGEHCTVVQPFLTEDGASGGGFQGARWAVANIGKKKVGNIMFLPTY